MKVLLLGGTGEARELAGLLAEAGIEVVSSLAGRTTNARLPAGEVRSGGFGGPEGLGLSVRFALAGHHIIIGSRGIERAKEGADKVHAAVPNAQEPKLPGVG